MQFVVDKLLSLLTRVIGLSVIFFCLVNIVAFSAILVCLVGLEAVMGLIPGQTGNPENNPEVGGVPDILVPTHSPMARITPLPAFRRGGIGKTFGNFGVNGPTLASERPVRVQVVNGKSDQDPLSA